MMRTTFALTFFLAAACSTSAGEILPFGTDTSTDTAEDVTSDTAADTAADTTADAPEDPSEDADPPDAEPDSTVVVDADSDSPSTDVGEPDAVEDAPACIDGESTSAEVFCEDGTIGRIACTCIDGEWECSPDPCAEPPTSPCSSDSDCSALDYCDDCATSSCPDCDDCIAGCLPHGCPTEPEPTCRALRPDCARGEVAIVEDGCWVCVNQRTCEPASPSSDCEDAGASCFATFDCPGETERIRSSCEPTGGICCQGEMGFCDDGEEVVCDMIEPTCETFEVLAAIGGCWQCVNPATCAPWGEPGCETNRDCDRGEICDECASGSCPFCEDCVPGCVPAE